METRLMLVVLVLHAACRAATAQDFACPPTAGRVTSSSAVIHLVTSPYLDSELPVRVRWSLTLDDIEHSPFVTETHVYAQPLRAVEIVVGPLQANTRYYYLVQFKEYGDWHNLDPGEFFTQKTGSRPFSFCMLSDGHWGNTTCGYEGNTAESWNGLQCLQQILADGPFDFCIDGGDPTVLVGVDDQQAAVDRYLGYRQVMSTLLRRMTCYFVLGNHEREAGYYRRGRPDRENAGFADNLLGPEQYLQKWGTEARLTFIPNPRGDTYPQGGESAPGYDTAAEWGAGSDPWNDGTCEHLQNFYAWTWGDALFIVVDPFRYSLVDSFDRPTSPTHHRLGPTQLQWVADTLANSTQIWKFVIAHHQVGGGLIDADGLPIFDGQGIAYGRGSAIEADTPDTDQAVLHQLMVDYGVQFFLYGHDHAFTHSVLDGVNYICCARPTRLNLWFQGQGMRDSYGDLLRQGEDRPWMRNLMHMMGYAGFDVTAATVTLRWRRTGYSFQNGYPLDFDNNLPPRDWRESWFGRTYTVDSPFQVTVSEPPVDVDGIRTLEGAAAADYFQPPVGSDFYQQPVPVRPEDYTEPQVPMLSFPETQAAVDYVPETVYQTTWYRADLDCDGDVDLNDFATFAMCFSGASVTVPPPGCSPRNSSWSDLDGDGDVDLADFATLAAALSP
ncbi:MAG: metallophosphoesterase [Phycisphaerales bacterium]|nr:MAG: metallophosphoesterase [Phycisphaerales bacterium]